MAHPDLCPRLAEQAKAEAVQAGFPEAASIALSALACLPERPGPGKSRGRSGGVPGARGEGYGAPGEGGMNGPS